MEQVGENTKKTDLGFFTGKGGLQPNWDNIMAGGNVSFLNFPPDMRTELKAGEILAMAGVISFDSEGNYEVIFKTFSSGKEKEVSVNPKMEGETLYFTQKKDAEEFAARRMRGFPFRWEIKKR